MTPMLTPFRFQLNQEQLAAALSLAGLQPQPESELHVTPAPSAAVLQGTSILTPEGHGLTAEVEAALRVAASPQRLVSVLFNRAGTPVWKQALFTQGSENGPYVSQTAKEGTFDFALLPSATYATVLVDEMLGLTAMAAKPGGTPYVLWLSGYTALLSAADALQTARLKARLARASQPQPTFSPELLEDQLNQGLSATDTRWAVTAGRLVAPTQLQLARGQMTEGLAGLQDAGLMIRTAGEFTFTQAGYLLATSLGQLINTGGITQMFTAVDRRFVVSQTTIFRCAAAIWLAVWLTVQEQEATVQLFEADATNALQMVRRLLEPRGAPEMPPPPQPPKKRDMAPPRVRTTPAPDLNTCSRCLGPVDVSDKFCPRCGAAVSLPPEPGAFPVSPAAPSQAAPALCPQCQGPLKEGARFCRNCGAAVAPTPVPPTACPNCGRTLKPGAKFCGGCGLKF
ncbi:MAG: zinc ribbon domain-containing protein [Deltaproteobacteria bacterium]|nr:zinc ribbon domain-containing protein [Deltaproteobacteria bacterium]